jgi:RimJ/RimL family protein N-acetyltransferase
MPFDKQFSLTGTCVGARPLRRSDYDALHAVASDPLIWEQHPVPNRYEAAVFRDFFEESLASGGALLVTDLESGEVIGSSRFHGNSEERSEIEIGWTFLARSHWGGTTPRSRAPELLRMGESIRSRFRCRGTTSQA